MLHPFGWTEGSNIHFDARWAGDDADLSRRYAEELVALAPDILLRLRHCKLWRPSSGSPAASRSFSQVLSILSERVSSAAWHGRGATQPDLSRSNTA